MDTLRSADSIGNAGEPRLVNLISVDEANTLVKEYQRGADIPRIPVKGFTFDKQPMAAMKELLDHVPDLSGFRLYFGREKTGDLVAIVVGTDERNQDLVDYIYKTDALQKGGVCPPICDDQSPIPRD
jgi:hypothetical protein